MKNNERQAFSKTESIVLDFTRFALAAVVMLAHMSQPYFNSSLSINLTYAGVLAVGGFFVLSGYTISGIHPPAANFSGSHFLGKRFGRLLSVSIPALLITYVLDLYSASSNPEYYFGFKTWHSAFEQWPLGFIANLALYSQPYGLSIDPLSNSPFWSLGYEAGFYVMYGAALLAMAKRVSFWLPVVAAVIYGPNVTLMAGLWVLGVLMHRVCVSAPNASTSMLLWFAMLITVLWELAGRATHHTRPTELITWLLPALGISNGRISAPLIIGAWAYIIGMIPLMRWAANRPNSDTSLPAISQLFRRLGALTFPIYLLHFPVFVFMKANGLWPDHKGWADLMVVAITMMAAMILMKIGERLNPFLTRLITAGVQRLNLMNFMIRRV
jgi:peptidoglycan/LPS O-acetylase OafA/YrhL